MKKSIKQKEELLLKSMNSFSDNKLIKDSCNEYYINIVENLKKEIKEKEFRITVIGEFSAGKSTFLNALIGKDILPHAMIETTAAITYIHNVPKNHKNENIVVINFMDKKKKPLKLNILDNPDALKDFSTTQSKELNVVRDIKSVEVYVNFKNIDDKVVFIDTPGLNGVADGHRDLTMQEIKNAHASICLFHMRGLSASHDFLKIISKHQKSILFIMNFIDELKENEGETLDEKLSDLKDQLEGLLIEKEDKEKFDVKVFGISALQALVSKDTSIKRIYQTDEKDIDDIERFLMMEQSKFNEFENYLWNTVIDGDKNSIFYESIKQKFLNNIEELQEHLELQVDIIKSPLEENELEDISDKMKKLEENFIKSWNKIVSFIDSRKFDLNKDLINKLKQDFNQIEDYINYELQKETFESIEEAIDSNKYGKLLQNKVGDCKNSYSYYLEEVLEEIYQSSILRLKSYNPTMDLAGMNSFSIKKKINVDIEEKSVTENKIKILKEENQLIKVNKEKNLKSINNIKAKQKSIEQKINSVALDIKKTDEEHKQKINMLGREPSIEQIRKTETVKVKERSILNPLRWFGDKYVTETRVTNIQDSSKRDSWRRSKVDMERRFISQKNMLDVEREKFKSELRNTDLMEKQEKDNIKILEKRIKLNEERINRAELNFNEIMSKHKREYLTMQRKYIINKVEEHTNTSDGNIYLQMNEMIRSIIDSSIAEIKQYVREYNEKMVTESRKRMDMIFNKKSNDLIESEVIESDLINTITALKDIKNKL